jgi:hypothetical protein
MSTVDDSDRNVCRAKAARQREPRRTRSRHEHGRSIHAAPKLVTNICYSLT